MLQVWCGKPSFQGLSYAQGADLISRGQYQRGGLQIDDDETGTDETVDPIQVPSDDGDEEDSYLVVMRPNSSYPTPYTPIWVMRCALIQSILEED